MAFVTMEFLLIAFLSVEKYRKQGVTHGSLYEIKCVGF